MSVLQLHGKEVSRREMVRHGGEADEIAWECVRLAAALAFGVFPKGRGRR